MTILEIAGIAGGAISIISILWRISDTYRKTENVLDDRFSIVNNRLSKLEGKLESYDSLLSGNLYD